MDITGTTALEADKTITGSFLSMKAAWQDLLPALIIGGDKLDTRMNNFVSSVMTYQKNIMPAIEKVLYGIGELITKMSPVIEKELPNLIDKLTPPLIKASTSLLIGLIKALPSIIKTVIKEIPNVAGQLGNAIADAIGGKEFSDPIKGAMGTALVGGIVAFKGTSIIKSLSGSISSIKGVGNSAKGLSKSITPLQSLAKIKTKTVLKGLANLSIILGGLTLLAAALMSVAPYIAQLSDMKSLAEVIAVMSTLGTVGAVMTKFAGIVGSIPIPTVLSGLANIALAIAGFTIIVAAFAELSKHEGFNDFINKGGESLANLFKQLGKIVGSIVGGIGEGLSSSLINIGGNLSAFAVSIKPMFDTLKDVDTKSVGSFFKSIGSFMLQMAGNDIASFFTGGTDFAKLGNDLTTFANNSSGFFTTVSSYPDLGFTNATKLFDCLAGMKSLPKDGGVFSWFTGNINYSGLADGLSQLGSEKVSGFFASVSSLQEAGFTNATKLFDCLSNMKSLPKDGGFAGWFSGDIDYTKIASGLGSLASEGVSNFFAMVSTLKESSFTNATKLFECLANMSNLTSGDGFWERLKDGIFGDGESMLSKIGSELGAFTTNVQPFFNQINTVDVEKINSLQTSLNNLVPAFDNVSTLTENKFINLSKVVDVTFTKINTDTMMFTEKITNSFMNLNLESAGIKMMLGLERGIVSMRGRILSAVDSVALSISRKFSNALSNINTNVEMKVANIKGKIPKFAKGGTVTTPQMAVVGDAPETIVPHGNTPRNRALLDNAAKGVYGNSNSGGNTINISFAPVINGGNAEENRRMLQEEEAEFERKMDEYFAKKGRLDFDVA